VVAQPGDLVLFGKYAGQDTAVPRVTDIAPPRLIVMRDIEVLAAKPKDKYDWNELLVCHDLDPRKIHFKWAHVRVLSERAEGRGARAQPAARSHMATSSTPR
jgi:hypothetical protein